MNLLSYTGINFSKEVMVELLEMFQSSSIKETICTYPDNGDRYYGNAVFKDEYKNTAVEIVSKSIKDPQSQVCVIIQDLNDSYPIHTDIDDRFHLNIQSEYAYFVDFENNHIEKICTDGRLYLMNTGILHSATNYGKTRRIQLAATKRLEHVDLKNRLPISITAKNIESNDISFNFNIQIMPWLNKAHKQKIVDNYKKLSHGTMYVDIEAEEYQTILNLCKDNFIVSKV